MGVLLRCVDAYDLPRGLDDEEGCSSGWRADVATVIAFPGRQYPPDMVRLRWRIGVLFRCVDACDLSRGLDDDGGGGAERIIIFSTCSVHEIV